MGKKIKIKKGEKKPVVEEGALVLRHRTIIPDLRICASNCLNWDIYQRCPIFMKGRLCSSWRPRDLGDPEVVVEEQAPYQWETDLGSAKVKGGKGAIEPPTEEVDAGEGETEEAEENG